MTILITAFLLVGVLLVLNVSLVTLILKLDESLAATAAARRTITNVRPIRRPPINIKGI